MSSQAVAPPSTGARHSEHAVRGRVHVRARAIEKVVREASAAVVGVSRDDIDIDVSEWGGSLAVKVSARLPIPDLGNTEAILAEVPILERVRTMQDHLAREFGRLTGREIHRVSFVVSGATIPPRKRVM